MMQGESGQRRRVDAARATPCHLKHLDREEFEAFAPRPVPPGRPLCGEIGWLRTPTLPAGRTIPLPDRSLPPRSESMRRWLDGVRLRTSFIVPHIGAVPGLGG